MQNLLLKSSPHSHSMFKKGKIFNLPSNMYNISEVSKDEIIIYKKTDSPVDTRDKQVRTYIAKCNVKHFS